MFPNYFWYVALLTISLIALVIAVIKHPTKKRLFQTYFFITGLAYFVDYNILVIFNAYDYHPNLAEHPWLDTTFGSIFSQGISVPIAATIIAGFNLGFITMLLTAFGFMGIEELFRFLGIYEHHWWKTWYTGILLLIAFSFAKVWYQLLANPSATTKFITIYMTLIVYTNTLRFFMLLLFSTHLYKMGWFEDPIRDHIAGNALLLFIYSVPVTVVVLQFSWIWILFILIIEIVMDYTLIGIGVIELASYWNPFYFAFLLLTTLIGVRWLYVKWFP
ncbi:hypothetical protein GMD78_05830 [Ornithinibacillus sp. L9]|uniref:Uncharacterized protein n=1 Tax=Ornithinibacillus caprae TaxID=2678566 RepID=A0A6N8FIW4_9BACI|nr:hypothetical protein [Ornithinibacillus caprae]MUK87917.1 hypothetical protein [Ornithinibacillus caprae]